MSNFIKGKGDWTKYRELGNYQEVDFHYSKYDRESGQFIPYRERMGKVWQTAFDALKQAQEDGIEYIIFTHGHSTSRRGATTSRSVVRNLMRSKESTPYIISKNCIQHSSVFVASIRPKSK